MPTITMQDGAKITLPDGATDEQIQEAAEDYAANLNATQLTPKQIDQKLPTDLPTNMGAMPNGTPLPYGIDQKMIDAQNRSNAQSNERNTSLRQNPTFMDKVAKENESGVLETMAKSAINTASSMGAGIGDLADEYLPETLSDALAWLTRGDRPTGTPESRMKERAAAMDQLNEGQIARTVASPVSSTVGSMAPYLVTGSVLNRAIDVAAGVTSPLTRQLVQKSLDRVNPSMGMRFANRPDIPSDFATRAGYMAKAPIIGAAEGGIDYNQSVGEGALNSVIGSTMGLLGPLRKVSRVENILDKNSKSLVKEMDEQGFSLTPGVRTGNKQMQTEEAGIKNSDALGTYYYQKVTRPNQRKMTEMAGDAIGLNGKGRDTFSTDELSSHLDNLRAGYQNLEANTTGKFDNGHFKVATDILNDLKPTASRNRGPNGQSRYQTVKAITDQIKAESTPGAGVSGITNRTFDGAKYQEWRKIIQDETNQAYKNNDKTLGDALVKLRNNLDNALESSMGKAKASEWRDLNERYAMTNLLLKNGMTPQGAIDPLGITSAVMKGDEAIRTLTGKGGRIKQFQKIARYNDVLNNVEGGSLTGLGKADLSADRSLVKTPLAYRLPLYPHMVGAYRLSRLPTYGLGATSGMQIGRAAGMTEPLPKIAEAATLTAEGFRDWLTKDEE